MTRILMTNLFVAKRTGSEIATVELAIALVRRGHEVAIYAPVLGGLAELARSEGVVVVDDPARIPFVPDIIHGHHAPVFVTALAAHPAVPALFVSHSAISWVEAPPDIARMVRSFAVAGVVRERAEAAVPRLAGRVDLLLNAADLARFERRPALPQKPRRALILTKQAEHVGTIRQAASAEGLTVDALGPGVDKEVDDLPGRLRDYDIVFATARMAIEALAVGCAVVVVDQRGLAGLVTLDVVESWRQDNFGLRLLQRPVDAAAIRSEIQRYDAMDAAAVCDWIRADANLDELARQVEVIHAGLIEAARSAPPVDMHQELKELGAFWTTYMRALGWFANPEHGSHVDAQLAEASLAFSALSERFEEAQALVAALGGEVHRVRSDTTTQLAALQGEVGRLALEKTASDRILRSRGRTFRHWLRLTVSGKPKTR